MKNVKPLSKIQLFRWWRTSSRYQRLSFSDDEEHQAVNEDSAFQMMKNIKPLSKTQLFRWWITSSRYQRLSFSDDEEHQAVNKDSAFKNIKPLSKTQLSDDEEHQAVIKDSAFQMMKNIKPLSKTQLLRTSSRYQRLSFSEEHQAVSKTQFFRRTSSRYQRQKWVYKSSNMYTLDNCWLMRGRYTVHCVWHTKLLIFVSKKINFHFLLQVMTLL